MIAMGGDSWQPLLLALGLGAARTIPLAWLVPALGGPRVPGQVRIGLGYQQLPGGLLLMVKLARL